MMLMIRFNQPFIEKVSSINCESQWAMKMRLQVKYKQESGKHWWYWRNDEDGKLIE